MKKIAALLICLFLFMGMFAFAEESWICSNCGAENVTPFCGQCGMRRPESDWVCPNCGNTAGTPFCPYCGTQKPEGIFLPTAINVPAIEARTLSIDPIRSNTAAIENATILAYSGNITCKDQCDSYIFEAPYDGTYRADIGGMQSGTAVGLYIIDSLGNTLGANSYCTNSKGVTVDNLSGGSTYEVKVVQENGFSSYSLTIGLQKAGTDISDLTELTDSIEFSDQRNEYSFIAPRDGRYRFELSGMKSGTAVELYVFNVLGEKIASNTYCQNGGGVTVEGLCTGEKYNVQIRQSYGFSNYIFSIGHQKATMDISDLTFFTDSVEYIDQKNMYSFTALMDGSYRFELSGMRNGTAVRLYVFDDLGETVASNTYCKNGEGVTVSGMISGKVYDIQVWQDSGLSAYNFTVGQQKETVNVSNNVVINDSIEYTDQRNVYLFTANRSDNVELTISGMNSDSAVELYVFNDLEETIASNTYCRNDGGITIKNVTAGTHYEIQVRQGMGKSKYTLSIN